MIMKKDILVVSDKTFDKEVMNSSLPVLVDFGATWCGLCRVSESMVEDIATQYKGRLKVCRVDVDKSKKQKEFNLRGVPAFLTFKAGKKKSELVGLVPKDQLLLMVEDILK
jgi:thioredoxin 1